MHFSEAVQYLYSLGNEVLAMKQGLETIRTLAAALGDPQRKFPAVHIAGTNGKGSTAAMTASITRAAGLRTGLYTSPHLINITERIRVNFKPITPTNFARLATQVRTASEQLVAEGMLPAPPTFFEQVTMIGFLHFAERRVDVAVLEVGLGGRLDATNICEPLVTAITPVGFDHQQYLGNTLAEIAGEKAGIIKTGVPVVVSAQDDEAMTVIQARAEELFAPLASITDSVRLRACEPTKLGGGQHLRPSTAGQYVFDADTPSESYHIQLQMRGRHQVTNALTAIRIVETLRARGLPVKKESIVCGLQRARWAGRLQMIELSEGQPVLLLDGAHNPAGAHVLRDFLNDHCRNLPITMIFGVMQDKAPQEMATLLFPFAQKIILTRADNPRATTPQRMARELASVHSNLSCADGLPEALAKALSVTAPEGVVVICGSLYLVGETLAELRRIRGKTRLLP